MDSVESETKFALPDDHWIRIVTETPRYAEGATWHYLDSFPRRYYRDNREITVEEAGRELADAGYPIRCEAGTLVRFGDIG